MEVLKMVKRHKPSNSARAGTHAATDNDYQKLSKAVLQAIVTKCKDIHIKLPYFVDLDPTFPRGILYRKDECFNWYRCKTFKVADWLNERGFLPGDAKMLVKMTRTVTNLVGEVDRLLENPQQEFLKGDKILVDKIDEEE